VQFGRANFEVEQRATGRRRQTVSIAGASTLPTPLVPIRGLRIIHLSSGLRLRVLGKYILMPWFFTISLKIWVSLLVLMSHNLSSHLDATAIKAHGPRSLKGSQQFSRAEASLQARRSNRDFFHQISPMATSQSAICLPRWLIYSTNTWSLYRLPHEPEQLGTTGWASHHLGGQLIGSQPRGHLDIHRNK
jgi:hypothetical protein